MNKGQYFTLGDEGELHEIGELKEVDTLLPSDLDKKLEKTKKAWRHFEKQIVLMADIMIKNCRDFIDMLYGSEPKYIRTERKFPKKKKRGTMRRQRRERRANE